MINVKKIPNLSEMSLKQRSHWIGYHKPFLTHKQLHSIGLRTPEIQHVKKIPYSKSFN